MHSTISPAAFGDCQCAPSQLEERHLYPFKGGDFAPRNGWYVAAFGEDIGEKLLSRWILGEPVVEKGS